MRTVDVWVDDNGVRPLTEMTKKELIEVIKLQAKWLAALDDED